MDGIGDQLYLSEPATVKRFKEVRPERLSFQSFDRDNLLTYLFLATSLRWTAKLS